MSESSASDSNSRSFTLEMRGSVYVVRFNHDTFYRQEVERVRDDLRRMIDSAEVPHFIIDFEHVHFMSSVILGVIMGIHLKICRKKGKLALSGMIPEIRDIFTLMRLDRVLTIYPTVDEAMAHFT